MKALNQTIIKSFAKIEATSRKEMARLRSEIAAYADHYGIAETCNSVNIAIDSWRQIGVKGVKLQQRVRRLERALNAAGVLGEGKYFKVVKGKVVLVSWDMGYRLNKAGNIVKSRQAATSEQTTNEQAKPTNQTTPDATSEQATSEQAKPTNQTEPAQTDDKTEPTREELLKKIKQLQTALDSALQIIDLQEAELEAYHRYASRTATEKAESAVNQKIEAM